MEPQRGNIAIDKESGQPFLVEYTFGKKKNAKVSLIGIHSKVLAPMDEFFDYFFILQSAQDSEFDIYWKKYEEYVQNN